MGQFTVSRCTETPLRQDITPLYETKLAIVRRRLTKSKRFFQIVIQSTCFRQILLTRLIMYACHSHIQDGIRSITLHTCNMHVGICRRSMYWGVECSGRSGTFASEVKSAIRLLYRLNRPTELCLHRLYHSPPTLHHVHCD